MRNRTVTVLTATVLGLVAGSVLAADPPHAAAKPVSAVIAVPMLSSAGAAKVLAAAVTEANRHNWGSSIAIVDAAGHLLAYQRTDGAPLGTIDVARRKAETSIKFKAPTEFLQKMVSQGGAAMLTLGDYVAVVGGYPITVNGEVVGAIGVSGGMAGEDEVVAKAGLAALGAGG